MPQVFTLRLWFFVFSVKNCRWKIMTPLSALAFWFCNSVPTVLANLIFGDCVDGSQVGFQAGKHLWLSDSVKPLSIIANTLDWLPNWLCGFLTSWMAVHLVICLLMAVGELADLPRIFQAEWHADWLCGPTLAAAQLTSAVHPSLRESGSTAWLHLQSRLYMVCNAGFLL